MSLSPEEKALALEEQRGLSSMMVLTCQDAKDPAGGLVYDTKGRVPLKFGNLEGDGVLVGYWYWGRSLGSNVDDAIVIELSVDMGEVKDRFLGMLLRGRENRIESFGSPLIHAVYPQSLDTSGLDEKPRAPRRVSVAQREQEQPARNPLFDKLRSRLGK